MYIRIEWYVDDAEIISHIKAGTINDKHLFQIRSLEGGGHLYPVKSPPSLKLEINYVSTFIPS